MILLTISIILVTILIYKLIIDPLSYWDKLGVRRPKWTRYIYINWFSFLQQSAADVVQNLYECVPDTRYHGFHQFNIPALILKDPDLIKQIAIKAFDHFTDRSFTFANEDEPLFGTNLFNLKGQKWRDMRTLLSPSFTTNKMKMIFRIMDNCGKKFVQHFVNQQKDITETDMMDAFTRYTNDVIASSVFGVEVDSLKEPTNEFYLRGREATNIAKPSTSFKIMCTFVAPRLYKLFGLRILPEDTTEFFKKLINDSIKLREDGKIIQTDMIQLLLDAKKEYEEQVKREQIQNTKAHITNEDIIAQAFIFFFAGFESVARTMCFMAYELAVNPDVQQRLRAEIEEANENCNQQITYDTLMELKYMDMVVSEVLRKYPVQIAIDRICTKPYEFIPAPGEKPIHLNVGSSIFIPTFGLHRDPKLFPNPDKFDPERFNDENKSKIPSYAYQPFGIGPRACIGTRFALMETKLVYFHLLSKFEIIPTEKTVIPLVFLKSLMTLSSEFGFWFGLEKL